jgi:predicted MFS family arabinose efflux permease
LYEKETFLLDTSPADSTATEDQITTAVVSQPSQQGTPSELRREGVVLGAGWLLTWLATGICTLPIRLLLKNHLHLGAQAVSFFFLVTGFAWYFKPFAGILSDSMPLFGTRRRHYLLISLAAGGGFWLLLGALPKTYHTVLWVFLAVNAMVMIASTVLGGLLVEVGKRFSATGRLSSQRVAILNVVTLISGPLGGFLAARAFGLTVGVCAACLFGLLPIVFFFLREETQATRNRDAWGEVKRQFKTLLRSRPLWWGLAMNCLLYIAPGFGTPLLYYQQDTLKFSDQFIGNLAFISGACGLVGAVVYNRLCGRVSLRRLLMFGIVFNVIGTLFYLGYLSATAAMVIEGAAGMVLALASLPLYDLSARATPRGSEALGYSLMMSVGNLTGALSDVCGSWLYQHYHIHFMHLVWLNAGTTALVLIVVPFLPRMLMDRRDGEAGGEA